MSDDNGDTKTGGRTITLRGAGETTRVRQSFSHGRTKSVVVEKVRKRVVIPSAASQITPPAAPVAPRRPPPRRRRWCVPSRRQRRKRRPLPCQR